MLPTDVPTAGESVSLEKKLSYRFCIFLCGLPVSGEGESTPGEEREVTGTVEVLSNGRKIIMEAEGDFSVGVLALTLLHGSKTLAVLCEQGRSKVS